MKYKNYIKGGIKISELGFGAWQLGVESGWSSVSEKESEYMINTALDRGINFFDTAEMYPTCPLKAETTGDTETIFGNWIDNNRSKRSEIVLATKISGIGYNAVRNGEGINGRSIKIAIEGSLERLKTDYVDLYQLHWPNRGSYHFRQNILPKMI